MKKHAVNKISVIVDMREFKVVGFHVRAASIGKAQLLTVDSRV